MIKRLLLDKGQTKSWLKGRNEKTEEYGRDAINLIYIYGATQLTCV